jgi:hypothetical protein
MSAEGHQVSFGFTTRDSDHWTPESKRAAAENPDHWYEQMRQAMERAGEAFMAEHPDVFYQHLV